MGINIGNINMYVNQDLNINLQTLKTNTFIGKGFPEEIEKLPEHIKKAVLTKGCGIEVECENITTFLLDDYYWAWHKDNSLRNNPIEWVTKFGLRVKDMQYALDILSRGIEAEKFPGGFSFSERTSVHVHLDCRYHSGDNVRSLVILYTLVENSLFNFAGETRKHNIFCVPLRQTLKEEHYNTWDMVGNWDKYCAINLRALREYGTVEFRHMEGNMNPRRIFNWVMLLALLVEASRRMTLEEVKQLVRDIKGESRYRLALEKIFYNYTDLLHWNDRDIDRACSDSKLYFGEV